METLTAAMDTLPEVQEGRLVIAIDYGTTYTGVAVATPVGHRAYLPEIDVVQDWGPSMSNMEKIPSVYSYSLSQNGERQWGADLSPQSIAMVHTKLQLDVDSTSSELDLILEALDGMRNLDFRYIESAGSDPIYPRQSPEDIVEDYLVKVFEHLLEAVSRFTEEFRTRTPVDIVATIPASWKYRAKNSTFRALTRAGFNRENFPELKEMLLVSEPEAAAIYTARFLRDEKGKDFLKLNECFVLCDAGGGTVDVVSYKVKQLQPTFEIEKVTIPAGKKCGSMFINLAFKRWLRDLIGDAQYQRIDQALLVHKISSHDAEGERMRELMIRFNHHKEKFARGDQETKFQLDLPKPLDNLTIENKVNEGEITITYKDMESFFIPRASDIVDLIQRQLNQIEKLRTRVKNVFLVGGFAESQYVQESIRTSLKRRRIELQVPNTSWTAVVRGAAIFGIEKSTNKSLSTMSACARNYGVSVNVPFSSIAHDRKDRYEDPLIKTIMAKDQLIWLIKEGDLILSDRPKESEGKFIINFTENGRKTGIIPIYAYSGDDLPDRLSNSESDLTKVHEIKYDLRNVPMQEFIPRPAAPPNPQFFQAHLSLHMSIASTSKTLHVELKLGNRVICVADVVEP